MDQRERREKLEKLTSLDEIYIQVMFYRFLDKNVSQIKEILEISNEKTVWTRLTRIYEKLGITGDDKQGELIKEYSPIFLEFFKSEEDLKKWGHIRAEMLRQLSEMQPPTESTASPESSSIPQSELPSAESEDTQKASETQQGDVREESDVSRPRPIWPIIAISVFVLCVLCISSVLFVSRLIPFSQATPTMPVPTKTPTPLPTNTQPVVFTPTSSPTLTHTPLPPTPTSPSPTFTSTPTETPTPKPPAMFETSFDGGMPDGMEMVYGDIDFVDGELLAHELTLLSIGEDTWKNYQVEYETRKHTYCWGLKNNGIAAHATDPENMIVWSWNYCEAGWFEMVNGDWVKITGSKSVGVDPGRSVTIRFVAENGNFTVYTNNIKRTSYYDEKYTQGKVYIVLHNRSVIDNIYISLLP